MHQLSEDKILRLSIQCKYHMDGKIFTIFYNVAIPIAIFNPKLKETEIDLYYTNQLNTLYAGVTGLMVVYDCKDYGELHNHMGKCNQYVAHYPDFAQLTIIIVETD